MRNLVRTSPRAGWKGSQPAQARTGSRRSSGVPDPTGQRVRPGWLVRDAGAGGRPSPGAERTTRWAMQVVPINDWGEVGFPVVRTIVRDAVGPTLNMEDTFHESGLAVPGTAPRTVRARFVGQHRRRRGDPGRRARTVHGRDPPRSVAPDDPAHRDRLIGQCLDREFSIVGGVDYRRFPWALIAALALLGVVAARGLVAARVGPGPAQSRRLAWSTGTLDEASMPEIEDLPPGSGLAPADGGPRRGLALAGAAFRVAEPRHRVGRGAGSGAGCRWHALRVRAVPPAPALTAGVADARSRRGVARCRRWSRRCAVAVGALLTAVASGARSSAARVSAEVARPRVASMLSPVAVLAAVAAPASRQLADPRPGCGELPSPDRHAPQGDVERPQEQREHQQQRPQVRRARRRAQVVDPRVERRHDLGPAGRGAQRRSGTARSRRAAGTRRRSVRPGRPSARAASSPVSSA